MCCYNYDLRGNYISIALQNHCQCVTCCCRLLVSVTISHDATTDCFHGGNITVRNTLSSGYADQQVQQKNELKSF